MTPRPHFGHRSRIARQVSWSNVGGVTGVFVSTSMVTARSVGQGGAEDLSKTPARCGTGAPSDVCRSHNRAHQPNADADKATGDGRINGTIHLTCAADPLRGAAAEHCWEVGFRELTPHRRILLLGGYLARSP
jgi:hypothetical protein